MLHQLTEEILHILFHQCDNNPHLFTDKFNKSKYLIGFYYNSNQVKFTNVSHSFKTILGYDLKNILLFDKFTDKIIHPHDKSSILAYFNEIDIPVYGMNNKIKKNYIKGRLKHIKGYWKNFIFFSIDYKSKLNHKIDKAGILFEERRNDIPSNDHKIFIPEQYEVSPITNDCLQKIHQKHPLSISPRETEVLELIGEGLLTKEIADKLNISNSTVITHRKNLITKMQVRNTAELIKKAAKHMLI